MSDTKTKANEIYQKHIALASTDGRLFRKTVMDEIMAALEVSLASAATYYNNCKKAAPVEGLGRTPTTKGARKVTIGKNKTLDIIPDNECYTVIELIDRNSEYIVGRTKAELTQGDASESFDGKIVAWPRSIWVMIKGLGPNAGDPFKLNEDEHEKEIKRYVPGKENIIYSSFKELVKEVERESV